MNNLQLAWLAGAFEGEGTITLMGSQRARTPVLFVSVANTDLELLEPFQAVWGGRIYPISELPRCKQVYVWRLRARKALVVIQALLPYFKRTRVRERATLCIRYQLAKSARISKRTTVETRASDLRYLTEIRLLNQRGVAP